jgi:hypothetical protein
MGLSEAQINQPLVGVATTWNPCARLGVDGSHEPHRQAKGK